MGSAGGVVMSAKRKIEVFSAGCPVCDDVVEMVKRLVGCECGCGSEVVVLDMQQPEIAERARKLGVRSVPAVAIDGKLASCCEGRGPDEATIRAAIEGKSCCG